MATFQDCTIGFGTESTYGTGVTPTRWLEFLDESLDYNKNIIQGEGLRGGSRVLRSGRRIVSSSDGGGDFSVEVASKGMGLFLSYCLGVGTSTLVSGTTYQQNFTLTDQINLPTFTLQKGLPRVDGTIDPYTFTGCAVASWELTFGNDAILQMSTTIDARDVTTATGYAAVSYAAGANVFAFKDASIFTGTFTAPTTTVLASAATPLASVRSGSLSVDNHLTNDRYNFGSAGKKGRQPVGMREITGSLEVEYADATFRDAILNDTEMTLVLTYTGAALSAGTETFQVAIPSLRFSGNLPSANGGDLITHPLEFRVFDNAVAAQPLWVSMRTSDSAL